MSRREGSCSADGQGTTPEPENEPFTAAPTIKPTTPPPTHQPTVHDIGPWKEVTNEEYQWQHTNNSGYHYAEWTHHNEDHTQIDQYEGIPERLTVSSRMLSTMIVYTPCSTL